MLRASLLWLSERPEIFRFVQRNGLARRFASRFVAGETPEAAVAAVRELSVSRITGTVDLLGEAVRDPVEARAARDVYLDVLGRMRASGLESNVSVKLTQMGLDVDERLCAANVDAIVARATADVGFVRIDMEQSAYTAATLRLFANEWYPAFGNAVGVVLQSALRRTAQDVDQMVALGARVRLCKGAYQESTTVAFPDKRDVDANYLACMERLLERGNYPAIATHDERLIAHAKRFASGHSVGPERFEFQMIYGVRRDLQLRLRREGYRVRVYVPFGTHWYPYLMRRLAERPANIAFLAGNVLRESLRRR